MVNDAFKEKEKELKTAAGSLEKDTTEPADAVKVVRVANEGLILATNIVRLIG
jgi:hypothetical protein